jgi:hypothetical protein
VALDYLSQNRAWPKVASPANFNRREAAVAACIEEINNSLERVRGRKTASQEKQ